MLTTWKTHQSTETGLFLKAYCDTKISRDYRARLSDTFGVSKTVQFRVHYEFETAPNNNTSQSALRHNTPMEQRLWAVRGILVDCRLKLVKLWLWQSTFAQVGQCWHQRLKMLQAFRQRKPDTIAAATIARVCCQSDTTISKSSKLCTSLSWALTAWTSINCKWHLNIILRHALRHLERHFACVLQTELC